ncbi:MAG: hypothetical protein SGPRY_002573, partial [Prymnesium sp.]
MPSLLAPRPSLVDAALKLAAHSEQAKSPLIVWSAAEGPHTSLPIQSFNSSAGAGVYVEKILLDAYRPGNALLSLAMAGLTAVTTEVIRTDKIETLVRYMDGEEEEEEEAVARVCEPWEWSL